MPRVASILVYVLTGYDGGSMTTELSWVIVCSPSVLSLESVAVKIH